MEDGDTRDPEREEWERGARPERRGLQILMSPPRMTNEEHAKRAVGTMIQDAYSPWAPRLPERSTVFIRMYCQEGHEYWAPMSRSDSLCPEHRDDPATRAKYGEGRDY